jgi:outer membrane protein TolC
VNAAKTWRRGAGIAVVIVVAILQGGCISSAGIGPEAAQLDISTHTAPDGSFDGWPQDKWWHAYGEAELDRLVAHALDKHPDLIVAHARLAEAAAAIAYVSARLQPTLGFNGTSV